MTITPAGGLMCAYARASRFRDEKWPQIREVLLTIAFGTGRKRPEPTGAMNTTLEPPAANLRLQTFAPIVSVREASLENRLADLENRLKRLLNKELPPILKDVRKLKDQVAEARLLAESEAEKALSAARVEIAALAAKLDRTQTLDIRWAARGLLISAIGTFLQYWT
ncbi:hypothetical protein [Mycobacteroides abscessus]|uniref:hypothetical protein n=1 Tax=Mycobacteroides abscessus TaxID=36809 RepID=UPI001F2CAA7F|nr:hypothetical protein [Mycobacteroides abscessus]